MRKPSRHARGASHDAPLLPFVLLSAGVLAFVLWPTIAILRESLYPDGSFSLACYEDLIVKNYGLIENSLFIGFWTTLFALSIGLCCALYVTHTDYRGKRAVLAVLMMTLISPPFMSSLSYIMLFGRRGLISWKLLGLHWNPYGPHGIILMESVGLASIAAFLIMAVLKGMDRDLETASLDLGAGKGATLTKITLPLARPGIVTAGLIVFIRSLSDFGTPIFIGGNYSVLATHAYTTAVGSYDLPKAAAISTLLLLPALVAFVIYRRLMGKNSLFSVKPGGGTSSESRLPRALGTVIYLVVWSYVAFEIAKYGAIFCGAFVKTWGVDFSLTYRHMEALKIAKMGSLFRSLKYAFTAATAAGLMGVLMARYLGRAEGPLVRMIDFVADLPFILPGPFFGIAYLLAFNWMPEAVLASGFLIVTNCVYRQLSIGIKSGISVMGQINPELEDAVRDQGGGPLAALRDVTIPLMTPAFAVSFINTFTFTMTTVGGIIFLITPYTKVMTAEMFEAIQSGDIGASSAMASVIVAVTMAVNLIFSRVILGGKRREDRDVSSTERP
ncbi:iron ABC transporter permease [Dethiosulfovibrio sp. F2B]|uniref:ABC transporter permease n=1 Tax=Dethiosulfovibrio faecalis TaxID=2720018 RepID=UPI001F209840|nr:iron ABC transporter permease [Dethiosulfovibrio faecalis]